MASKVTKHICQFQVISHWLDFSRLLVMCSMLGCNKTDILKQDRVRLAPRKFRAETDEEWKERWSAIPHICCPT